MGGWMPFAFSLNVFGQSDISAVIPIDRHQGHCAGQTSPAWTLSNAFHIRESRPPVLPSHPSSNPLLTIVTDRVFALSYHLGLALVP